MAIAKASGFCHLMRVQKSLRILGKATEISESTRMVDHVPSKANLPQNGASGDGRAPWTTPKVIVSDLGDARANTIIPGGDGSVPSYGPYGS